MRKRNIEYIADTEIFKSLISAYELNYGFYESELLLWNENLIINIYGYTIEKIFYIEFFSKDLKLQTNTSGVFPRNRIPEIRTRYQEYKTRNTDLLGISESVNAEVLLQAEKYLLFYLELFKELLGDYFAGVNKLNQEDHEIIENHNRLKLARFFCEVG